MYTRNVLRDTRVLKVLIGSAFVHEYIYRRQNEKRVTVLAIRGSNINLGTSTNRSVGMAHEEIVMVIYFRIFKLYNINNNKKKII